MDILQLDINQCDDAYYVPNAFKNTHKCDAKTSYVSVHVLKFYCIFFLNKYVFYSVYRFWVVVLTRAVTNVNVYKVSSIHLKI